MKRPTYLLLLLAVVFSLVNCSGEKRSSPVPSVTVPTAEPTSTPIDNPRKIHTSITSAITGIEYPVHIQLPVNYELPAEANQQYPVIYATDGQWVFDGFAAILDSYSVNTILVAIEQGPNDRRATDYRLPGAEDYLQFIFSELIPTIESTYRVDGAQRTLSGTSYGGLFVGLALLMDDVVSPTFKNYLSFDGSFFSHWVSTQNLEQQRYNASQEMNARLLLTTADIYGNRASVQQFQTLLESRDYTGLTIDRMGYDVVHEEIADPSFRYAVERLFSE
ncbi:alpha/beta hydrolase [Teredinibacter haidensis]|uniref:alpha/beta hydrolase n=1 Tax=Teredinibacter haidensis TaxID=2731755 RepID=UPI000948C781|nr:alpha/beta hydrolase-fold protein [Teredinibacter haidensis]